MNAHKKYLETFFEEKDLPIYTWDLEDNTGMFHIIDSEVVIDFMINTLPEQDQEKIRIQLVKIDFHNAPVEPFLKHVATYIINNY